MDFSRRDLAILLSALATPTEAAEVTAPILTSKGYQFNDLPVRKNASGTTASRAVLNGVTTRGQHITVHISELGPGQAPHPPARQPHDEIIVIREGTLEGTLNGQTNTLGPGSVIFSSFNDLNGWKNVGTTTAQYYVISLEEHTSAQ